MLTPPILAGCIVAVVITIGYLASINKALTRLADVAERKERNTR